VSAPPAVKRIILELSLRFQPTDEIKRAAFNEKVALLVVDCAAVPPEWLERAAQRWISDGEGFLPPASALVRFAQDAQNAASMRSSGEKDFIYWLRWCEARNRANGIPDPDNPNRANVRWLPKNGGGAEPMTLADYRREMASRQSWAQQKRDAA